MRATVLAIAAAIATALIVSPDHARADSPVKITVIGVDGKPMASGWNWSYRREIGDDFVPKDLYSDPDSKPTAGGSVSEIEVQDAAGNRGYGTVFIPESGTGEVTVTLSPKNTGFDRGYNAAKDAKATGNTAAYDAGIAEAERALAQEEAEVEQAQQAVNAWAIANKLPVMTLKQINKRIERAENLPPGETEPLNLGDLKLYRARLEQLKSFKTSLGWARDRLADLKGPKTGAFFMPGNCGAGTLFASNICGERGGDSFRDRDQEQESDED